MYSVGSRDPCTSHALNSEEEGPCASDSYSEPERQELHLMAFGRILVPVQPTLHIKIDFILLMQTTLGILFSPSTQAKTATLCPMVSAEDGEVVGRELCTCG